LSDHSWIGLSANSSIALVAVVLAIVWVELVGGAMVGVVESHGTTQAVLVTVLISGVGWLRGIQKG